MFCILNHHYNIPRHVFLTDSVNSGDFYMFDDCINIKSFNPVPFPHTNLIGVGSANKLKAGACVRLGTRFSLGAGGARARMASGSTVAQADVGVT